jgi:hypothetical protein
MTFASDVSWHEDAAKQARTLQIIVAGLIIGCLSFLLITLGVGPMIKPPALPPPISLSLIAWGLFGLEFIAWIPATR